MKPNIVLITIDTLRYDHCSCNGYSRKTTPFIDKLAKRGINFDHAFANGPLTPRSFPSLLCGVYPFEGKISELSSYHLPKNLNSISETLQAEGYNTAAFQAANPFISRYYGYNRGFDEFFDYLFDSKIENDIEKKENKLKRYFIELVKRNQFLSCTKSWRNNER